MYVVLHGLYLNASACLETVQSRQQGPAWCSAHLDGVQFGLLNAVFLVFRNSLAF